MGRLEGILDNISKYEGKTLTFLIEDNDLSEEQVSSLIHLIFQSLWLNEQGEYIIQLFSAEETSVSEKLLGESVKESESSQSRIRRRRKRLKQDESGWRTYRIDGQSVIDEIRSEGLLSGNRLA